jgi:bile acid:Na+ symporter, BASS family
MDPRQLVLLAFQISIISTVFGFGLRATPDDLLYVLRRPGLLARSMIAMFLIMPLVAVALSRWLDFPRVIAIELIALALSPTPPLLPGREARSGGHESYGLGLMAVLALLSIAIVPLSLKLLGTFFGLPFTVSPATIAGIVFTAALLPLTAGILVRRMAPALAARLERPVWMLVMILMPLAVAAVLITTAPAMWRLVGTGTLLAILVFLLIGFAAGHVLGGPDPDHSIVLALSTACRHPAIALSIASANYPDERFGPGIILYLLLGFVVGVPYVVWLKRQMSAGVPA